VGVPESRPDRRDVGSGLEPVGVENGLLAVRRTDERVGIADDRFGIVERADRRLDLAVGSLDERLAALCGRTVD